MKKLILLFNKKNRLILLALFFFIILFYGTFIRFYGLGDDSFWIDESISALAAKKISLEGEPLLGSGHTYSRSSIFHNLMSFFFYFGFNDFNARIISVIFGIATCLLIFVIGKEFNITTAWIGFIFSLFMEIFVVNSRQARMYQMTMFFFFLTLYFLYKYSNSKDKITFNVKDKHHIRDILKENLYSSEKKYFWWALVSFYIVYNTHIVALILIPFFIYCFISKRMNIWIYIIICIILLYLTYSRFYMLDEFRFWYLRNYFFHLKNYAPFFFISIIGVIIGYKKKITWFLTLSAIFLMMVNSVNKLFAHRYIYLAFLPIVIMFAYTLSNIKFKWVVAGIYLVWISNIITPFTYTAVLIPTTSIPHKDLTAPSAEFKQLYNELNYTNETLIVTFTPAAEWYFRKPDYWIQFSFSGFAPSREHSAYNGRDIYTGAEIIHDFKDFQEIGSLENTIFVLDDWGLSRINREIATFINDNCISFITKKGVTAYRCLNETVTNNSSI
jgi:hypothetical protein